MFRGPDSAVGADALAVIVTSSAPIVTLFPAENFCALLSNCRMISSIASRSA